MAEGSFDGKGLTIWAVNDGVRMMLDKKSVLQPVEDLARKLTGGPVRVEVRTGRAPAETAPSVPAADGPLDALDAFLAENPGNVTVE